MASSFLKGLVTGAATAVTEDIRRGRERSEELADEMYKFGRERVVAARDRRAQNMTVTKSAIKELEGITGSLDSAAYLVNEFGGIENAKEAALKAKEAARNSGQSVDSIIGMSKGSGGTVTVDSLANFILGPEPEIDMGFVGRDRKDMDLGLYGVITGADPERQARTRLEAVVGKQTEEAFQPITMPKGAIDPIKFGRLQDRESEYERLLTMAATAKASGNDDLANRARNEAALFKGVPKQREFNTFQERLVDISTRMNSVSSEDEFKQLQDEYNFTLGQYHDYKRREAAATKAGSGETTSQFSKSSIETLYEGAVDRARARNIEYTENDVGQRVYESLKGGNEWKYIVSDLEAGYELYNNFVAPDVSGADPVMKTRVETHMRDTRERFRDYVSRLRYESQKPESERMSNAPSYKEYAEATTKEEAQMAARRDNLRPGSVITFTDDSGNKKFLIFTGARAIR